MFKLWCERGIRLVLRVTQFEMLHNHQILNTLTMLETTLL